MFVINGYPAAKCARLEAVRNRAEMSLNSSFVSFPSTQLVDDTMDFFFDGPQNLKGKRDPGK